MGFLQKHPEIYIFGHQQIAGEISSLGLLQESAESIMRKTPHLKPRERLLRLATLDRHQTNRIGRVQGLETKPRSSPALDYQAKGHHFESS